MDLISSVSLNFIYTTYNVSQIEVKSRWEDVCAKLSVKEWER